MTTPLRPVPDGIVRWVARRRWLRWADAAVAWLLLWAGLAMVVGPRSFVAVWGTTVNLVILVIGRPFQPLRVRWRPISGWVGLRLSRDLRPGDRAWYVGPREASLVVVTARQGTRVVIARADLGDDEGMSVRRTRVLLLRADGP